jgi:hypothetical protein
MATHPAQMADTSGARELPSFSFTSVRRDEYDPALCERALDPSGEVAEWSKARPC